MSECSIIRIMNAIKDETRTHFTFKLDGKEYYIQRIDDAIVIFRENYFFDSCRLNIRLELPIKELHIDPSGQLTQINLNDFDNNLSDIELILLYGRSITDRLITNNEIIFMSRIYRFNLEQHRMLETKIRVENTQVIIGDLDE